MTHKPTRRSPSYLHHNPSGQAFCYVYEGRKRKTRYLGRYQSPESYKAFAELLAEPLEGQAEPVHDEPAAAVPTPTETRAPYAHTIGDVVCWFVSWASERYAHSSEKHCIALSMRPLLKLYRHLPAGEFDVDKLLAVRNKMNDGTLSRRTVQDRIRRIRKLFKWGAGPGRRYVEASVYQSLSALEPLVPYASPAKESDDIELVTEKEILATLEHMSPSLRAMVLLQMHTGMRPGELFQIRLADLDMKPDVWIYRPRNHKMKHRGRKREIALGPKTQKILTPYLTLDRDVLVFTPALSDRERAEAKRRARKSKVPPSQKRRDQERRNNPKRTRAPSWTKDTYRNAIARACRQAGVPRWTPYRLRHHAATAVDHALGPEAARVLLGHKDLETTRIYIKRDLDLAIEVAKRWG